MSNIWFKMTDVTGESTDAGHIGEINVISWKWRFSKTHRDKKGKNTSVRNLSFVHRVDRASVSLLNHMLANKVAEQATLSIRSATAQALPAALGKIAPPPFDFSKINFKNVMVMELEPFGFSGGHFEEVIVSFTEFKWEYSPEKDGLAVGTAVAQHKLGPDVA